MHPIGETLNTPAFLGKLWKMVNDPQTDHLISWSAAGNSFVIQNQAQFMYELLPLYYKHNNMSSFVRQLNMYGFHKLSTVDNGTMDADRDEIQFSHPYFVKDQPQLLRNIKRKATPSKILAENVPKHDELTRILSDVKQLRGRQASVDNQLIAMKQENALLWREVAILRQKHLKQQKILIQFLVTLVQPSRMTVSGLKRGYQLMLNESPNQKKKKSTDSKDDRPEGPTIHELDSELDLAAPEFYEQNEELIVENPSTPGSSRTDITSPLRNDLMSNNEFEEWDKPEYVSIPSPPSEISLSALNDATLLAPIEKDDTSTVDSIKEKVFLNPATQDTLLSNLINGTDYGQVTSDENKEQTQKDQLELAPEATSESRELIQSSPSVDYGVELNHHVENTQTELDQLKDLLNNYNSYVDANALLGLFSDNSTPSYDLIESENGKAAKDKGDPLVSGSELTPYTGGFDFTELFDESLDETPTKELTSMAPSEVSTPQILIDAPAFPKKDD